jgi:hypothetical protein
MQRIRQNNANANASSKILILKDIIKTKPQVDVSESTLLIVGLVKNIQSHIKNLQEFFNSLKTKFKKTCFYFLTNNNTDNTINLLKTWTENDENVNGTYYQNIDIKIIEPNGTIGNRTIELAKLRNINITDAKTHFGNNWDYVLVLDTDLESPINISSFMTCFELDEDWDIICANSTYKNSSYHYDNFALRFQEDSDSIIKCYPNFNKFYGKTSTWVDKLYMFKSWYRVRCGFGGAMLIKGHLDIKWDIDNMMREDCEHLSLCNMYKNIFINPYFTYMQPMTLEGISYNQPLKFIPRDAGFFSAFNFYIGTLTRGFRCYPYWNKDAFMNINKKKEHFAYFTEIENSWFDYFNPVSFFENDNTDISKIDNNTQGEQASLEYKIPSETFKLMKSPQFKEWRHNTHSYYNCFIKPKISITNKVDNLCSHFSDHMIAVHYRHPSHCCEQGFVYLNDYFKKIDSILLLQPNSKIFIATDTEFGIVAFENKYRNRIIYNKDTTRTSLDNILNWAYARGNGVVNEVGFINNRGYQIHNENTSINTSKLGEDVIIDTYTICRCNIFIHTLSNIALACSYINPNLEMIMVS